EGGLPAARRPDERGNRMSWDLEPDLLHGEELAVVDVKVLDFYRLGHAWSFRGLEVIGRREVARNEERNHIEERDNPHEAKRDAPCVVEAGRVCIHGECRYR